MRFPRASSYRKWRREPTRLHPPFLAIVSVLSPGRAAFNPPRESPAMDANTIVVLEGDETGQELLEEALRVLTPDVLGFELELPRYDLSLESRRETRNEVVDEAARAIREAGLGLKAATVTPEGKDDVGSPNRILREEIGGHVIVRTGRRIPGVVPIGGVHQPISVVRMAVGDAYGAKEWRGGGGGGGVWRGPARIGGRRRRDGDILSDLVLPLFGPIAGSESLLVAFDKAYAPRALMAEAAHGTAPALQGKNVANPMAMILASAALLSHIDDGEARAAGRAIREACLEAVSAGVGAAPPRGRPPPTPI